MVRLILTSFPGDFRELGQMQCAALLIILKYPQYIAMTPKQACGAVRNKNVKSWVSMTCLEAHVLIAFQNPALPTSCVSWNFLMLIRRNPLNYPPFTFLLSKTTCRAGLNGTVSWFSLTNEDRKPAVVALLLPSLTVL